jgi:hypothetical protein
MKNSFLILTLLIVTATFSLIMMSGCSTEAVSEPSKNYQVTTRSPECDGIEWGQGGFAEDATDYLNECYGFAGEPICEYGEGAEGDIYILCDTYTCAYVHHYTGDLDEMLEQFEDFIEGIEPCRPSAGHCGQGNHAELAGFKVVATDCSFGYVTFELFAYYICCTGGPIGG